MTSTLYRKNAMALTGLFLCVFMVIHLAGNLQIFAGRDAMNSYAALLHSMPKVLWTLRIALIAAFVTHVVTSVAFTLGYAWHQVSRPGRDKPAQ